MSGLTPINSNLVSAMPDGPFMEDLARAVTNDGSVPGAALWLITFGQRYLQGGDRPHREWDAFDFIIYDIEAISEDWRAFRMSLSLYREQLGEGFADELPALARFLVERLPSIWSGPQWLAAIEQHHADIKPTIYGPKRGVSKVLTKADRIDTLVGFFCAGLAPNGSKDPFALRRAAKHYLMQVCCPVTLGLGEAA